MFTFALTFPVSVVAIVTVFIIGGLFLLLEGNIGSSVFAILTWVTLAGLQMRGHALDLATLSRAA